MTESTETVTLDDDGEIRLPTVELLTGRGFVTGKSGSGKSILEGTPVYTETGRKPIEDVSEGERVLSLNKHTYKQEFKPVQAVLQHDAKNLVKITLEDGTELVGTEDHSFLTIDDLEIVPIRGSEVTEGTWFPLARELPSVETNSSVDLADYAPRSNNLVISDHEIQSGPRTEQRHLRFCFETGKVIGLYLAEGSFDSGDTLQISNLDENVRTFLGEQGFNVYSRTCNKGFKPFANFLQSEFGVGAAGKSIPGWAYDTPVSFRSGIVSGYFDGDGTINDHTASALSKSPELLKGLKELLRQFGISTTIREKLTVYNGENRQYSRLSVDAFSMPKFADVVELSVTAKASKLRTLVATADGGDVYNSKDMIPGFGPVLNLAAREQGWTLRESESRVAGAGVHQLTRKQKAGRSTFNRLVDELEVKGRTKALGASDIQWKRVVDVTPVSGEETVYDLDVAVNDNFVANGVFVHNSNSASVIAEELLADGHPLLVVDTDGEYYGLKERYEVLHAGADEECDVQVGAEHAGKLAELALDGGVPVILDISGYLDEDEGRELVRAVVEALFTRERETRRPFLLLVEEVHEFIPESGGLDGAGKMLVRVAKRGRKRGLGFCGISQRPANVKKDVITQCDWLCWHRLTWDNDTSVVRRVMDSEAADTVQNLDDGEGIVVTDWDGERRRVQVRRKETFDAGATPGLGGVDRPELKSIGEGLLDDLQEISDRQREREDRVDRLERKLAKRNERIADLETELDRAKDLSDMAEQFTQALTSDNGAASDTDIDRRESTAREHHRQRDVLEDDDGTDEENSKVSGTDESEEQADRTEDTETEAQDAADSYADLLNAEIIHHQIQQAEAHSRASPEYAKGVIATLLDENEPVRHSAILTRLDISTTEDISTAATTLESMHIIEKEHTNEGLMVDLNTDGVHTVRAATIQRDRTQELAEEL